MLLGQKRYSSVAVALHWAIALLILAQIASGLYMVDLPKSSSVKFDLYQLHKSFGLSILGLTLIRLGWRLAHKPPALPSFMPGWQKLIARLTHWAFYALMLLTPLAGLAIVSVSPLNVTTLWFGLFEVPHLPFFSGVADRGAAAEVFAEVHEYLAFSILFLFVLHVGAALKHGFVNRDGVLRSMAPRVAALIGVALIFGALGLAAFAYLQKGGETERESTAPLDIALPERAPAAAVAVEPAPPPATEPVPLNNDNVAPEAVTTAEPETETTIKPASPEETVASMAPPPVWTVDKAASTLRFIGEEGGAQFEGRFSEFTAQIVFDPDNLGASSIRVDVKPASAGSGNPFRDDTMKDRAWFDVKKHQGAQFTSSTIRKTGANAYEAGGTLTIKDFSHDVTLAFTLDIDGDRAHAAGGADLIRTDYGLGMGASWLESEKVALAVRVEFEINAVRTD
jgi:cytochrome b561/polyisoprenoid-binding protein YceI